jgi:Anti-anti-sigma regulatory factor (antagonist of anti-sigma factor)
MVVEQINNNSVIKLPAKFTYTATNDFIKTARQELDNGIQGLFIDFSQTEIVDSGAIGALVSMAKDCKSKGVGITLRNINDEINKLFVETGFDRIFNIDSKKGIQYAESEIFDNSIDVRLYIEKEMVGNISIFHLSGIMNNPQGSRYFKQEILLSMAQSKKILLDFKELTYFDSLSVSVILNMNKLIRETGGSLRICGSNDIVDDLFTTLNIHHIIPFFKDQDEALANWD